VTATATGKKPTAVGIGHLAVSDDPGDVLVAYGLGSCVGMSAYDPTARVAGLIHVLLPDSTESRSRPEGEPARYADTAVDALIEQMMAKGARPPRLRIVLAGGAAVLGRQNAEKFKIGERNAEAIRSRLRSHGLRAAAEDLGGTQGRTMEVWCSTGATYVRTAAAPAREL
jgi:chemotaxis protein CheD